MDPDANLAEQRELVGWLSVGPLWNHEAMDKIHRLRELVTALDEWLSKGGALPKAWTRADAWKNA